ncbi:hypothetical protein SAMN04488544_0341 [Microlunatus sagamiharensis]|uniref:Heme peroxidase n=1 Tax=Microlunatus sagamiharensis TaxID=546874 RepID=A0A1H2LKT0_9ACTN|nr:hypothetical protein [Microlunatus sagamiharensis]SDU81181.1 hypothetical protein SAMN04488544_0341 [Microlunatus sagamiharensis]
MADANLTELVLRRVRDKLGDPDNWRSPTGYPDSLALCIIDSIQSLGVRYSTVELVVRRYRAARPGAADTDGPKELLSTFDDAGDVDDWARDIGTRNRTSTKPGAPLKAAAIKTAASFLDEAGVSSPAQLRALDPEQLAEIKTGWLRLPAQRSGISWRYFLMLAGVPGVKADRMICRFVQDATGKPKPLIAPAAAARAIEGAALRLGVSATTLDHAIWRWQSGRA